MTKADRRAEGEDLGHTRMTFGEHLTELRSRLFKALWASLIGLCVVFVYHEEVFRFVTEPFRRVMLARHEPTSLVATAPTQAFFSYVKLSFIVGLILTAPFWIYQIWRFIGAGLYRRERRVIYKFAPLCIGLFGGGVIFGYYVLIPLGISYLLGFAPPSDVKNLITIPEYLRLFTLLTLMLGVAFQLPIIMLGLIKANIATTEGLRSKRKYAIVVIFIIAAILTPPDPATQVLMAVPLVGLYQLGLFMGWLGLGSARPPIDWRRQWPFWRKILILVLLVVLFRDQIAGVWRRQALSGNLYAAADQSRPPILAIVPKLLGRKALGAYRVKEDGDDELWVVRTASRCFLLELESRRVRFQVVDRGGGPNEAPWVEFRNFPQEDVTYRLSLARKSPYAAFVPALLDALQFGGSEVREEVRLMLQSVSGTRPDGDDGEALESFRKWYAMNGQGSLGG